MLYQGQGLGWFFCNHFRGLNVVEFEYRIRNQLTYFVILNINMFCSGVIDGIIGKLSLVIGKKEYNVNI